MHTVQKFPGPSAHSAKGRGFRKGEEPACRMLADTLGLGSNTQLSTCSQSVPVSMVKKSHGADFKPPVQDC